MEIQALIEKTKANPQNEFPPGELGEIVTKILTFQSQYKSMSSKLDSTIDGLIQILKEHGISLPKS